MVNHYKGEGWFTLASEIYADLILCYKELQDFSNLVKVCLDFLSLHIYSEQHQILEAMELLQSNANQLENCNF